MTLESDGPVATLTLRRPNLLNAIDETPHDYYAVWDRSLRAPEELDAFVLCVMHAGAT